MDLGLLFLPQFSTSLFPVFTSPCNLTVLSLTASVAFLWLNWFYSWNTSSSFLVILYYLDFFFFNPLLFLSYLYLIPFAAVSINIF